MTEEQAEVLCEKLGAQLGVAAHSVKDNLWVDLSWALAIYTPSRRTRAESAAPRIRRIAANASKLHDDLIALDAHTAQQIVTDGESLSYLLETLQFYANLLIDEYESRGSRQGGKNLQAYAVAAVVARMFLALDREVTFGQFEGRPSTTYCRAVALTLEQVGIKANWRGPARAGYSKYKLRSAQT